MLQDYHKVLVEPLAEEKNSIFEATVSQTSVTESSDVSRKIKAHRQELLAPIKHPRERESVESLVVGNGRDQYKEN